MTRSSLTGLLRPRHYFRSLEFRKSSTGLMLLKDLLRVFDSQRTFYRSSEFRITLTGLFLLLVFCGQDTIKRSLMARTLLQVLYDQNDF